MEQSLTKSGENSIVQRTDPTMVFYQEWNKWQVIATEVYKSQMLSSSWKSPSAVMLGFMKCHELGIPAMTGIMGMYYINGKVSLEINLQNAIIERSGERAEMKIDEGEGFCKIHIKRKDGMEYTSSFTTEDMRKANLQNKDNWKNYQKDMLRARAFAIVNRVLFSHLLYGMNYVPEELGAVTTYTDGGEEIVIAEKVFDESVEFPRINTALQNFSKTKPTIDELKMFWEINGPDIEKMSDTKRGLLTTMYNRIAKQFGEDYVIKRTSEQAPTDATIITESSGAGTTTEPAESSISKHA